MVFHPRTNIHTKFPDQYPGYDFTYQLTNQLAPAILYDLYVQDEPDSPLYQFGYLESLTYPTTTLFGGIVTVVLTPSLFPHQLVLI